MHYESGGDLPYLTMDIQEIKAMPVREIAGVDAILWLWTTTAHLRVGQQLSLDALGDQRILFSQIAQVLIAGILVHVGIVPAPVRSLPFSPPFAPAANACYKWASKS